MTIDLSTIAIIAATAVFAAGIFFFLTSGKGARDKWDDLRDNGRLDGSNVNHAQIVTAALQGATEAIRAAQPSPAPIAQPAPAAPAAAPEYNGVGDPPSQEAWAKWLATLDPMRRSFYPPIWKPTPVSQANPAMDAPVTFIDGVATEALTREAGRKLVNGELGRVFSLPLGADVTMVTIAETSSSGDQVRYNLWGSDAPNGPATVGDAEHELQYNAAVLRCPAGTRFVNVCQLVAAGAFYIQAN